MFGLSDLKKTKVYQEGVEKGERKTNLKAVRGFLALGLSYEQIAEGLKLSLEEVRKLSQQPDEEDDS
jgi:predicted transposase YdaD